EGRLHPEPALPRGVPNVQPSQSVRRLETGHALDVPRGVWPRVAPPDAAARPAPARPEEPVAQRRAQLRIALGPAARFAHPRLPYHPHRDAGLPGGPPPAVARGLLERNVSRTRYRCAPRGSGKVTDPIEHALLRQNVTEDGRPTAGRTRAARPRTRA